MMDIICNILFGLAFAAFIVIAAADAFCNNENDPDQ